MKNQIPTPWITGPNKPLSYHSGNKHRTCARIWMTALLFVISISGWHPLRAQEAEPDHYTMGVFPYLPPAEIEKIFAPIAVDFSMVLGKPVKLRTSTTFTNFMELLDQQSFDIVFVQPFDYIHIADRFNYRPIASRSEPLNAVMVVKTDSTLNKNSDLRGKTIAMPPEVAAVSHMTKEHLRTKGLTPDKDVNLKFFQSHVSCMQQVLIGNADICSTAEAAKRFFENKMKTKLRIIDKTKSIPHSLFASHPRISEHLRKKLTQRATNWEKEEKGKLLLKRGQLKGFSYISDEQYNVVRAFKSR